MKSLKRLLAFAFVLLIAGGLLAGCGGSKTPYQVQVNDEAGQPVAGATIQFCSDEECVMGTTDDKGVATFDKEAGSYTVHVLKAPDGYAKDDTEYEAPEKPGTLTIVLKKE